MSLSELNNYGLQHRSVNESSVSVSSHLPLCVVLDSPELCLVVNLSARRAEDGPVGDDKTDRSAAAPNRPIITSGMFQEFSLSSSAGLALEKRRLRVHKLPETGAQLQLSTHEVQLQYRFHFHSIHTCQLTSLGSQIEAALSIRLVCDRNVGEHR